MTAEVPLRFCFDKEITKWTDPRREKGMGGFSTYEAWVGTLWAQYLGIWVCTTEASCNLVCVWELTTLLIQC